METGNRGRQGSGFAPDDSARFLYVIGGLSGGGSERQLVYLARALRSCGHEVTVAVWNFRESEVYVQPLRACGAVVVALEGTSRATKLLCLRRLIRATCVQLVQSFSFYLNVVVAAATAGTGAFPVGCVRSTLALAVGESGPLIGPVSARWPRGQVYNSAFAAREAARRRWWRPRRIAVLPNYVDVQSFADVEVPRSRAIAAIGSLVSVKRWDRLLALTARLRDQGLDVAVTVAGEGPLRPALEQEIVRAGLGDRVSLVGFVPDIRPLLVRSMFLVHVSDSEGLPNAVVEALAAGRAVVSTRVGDVAELVRDGVNGFVVAADDADMLFNRVALLLTDHERCAAMGRRARELARERWGDASLAHQAVEVYRQLGWIR